MPTPTPNRRAVRWSTALVAGTVAGMVMLLIQMLMIPLAVGGSAWTLPRMMAAIAMGPGVLTGAGFAVPFLVGMLVHFGLSIAFALVLAFLVRRAPLALAAGIGLGFGLALYFINYYVMVGAFPWFVGARNWVNLVAHLVFGAITAVTYAYLIRTAPPESTPHRRYEQTYAS
jgi:hypothetical protein